MGFIAHDFVGQWWRGPTYREECGCEDCGSCKERGSSRNVRYSTGYLRFFLWVSTNSGSHSYSYTYVETSVRNGVLEVLADHAVGPSEGTVRGVGSVVQPAKMTRNKYTETDDGILWTWVSENPQKGGGTDGNEIYKQLEAKVGGSSDITAHS